MNHKVSELSGGDKRVLSIAIAILGNPKILILDEPSASLDLSCRVKVWQTIKLLQKSMTLIISTQIVQEAELLCDRICILNQGQIVSLGTQEQIKNEVVYDLRMDISPINSQLQSHSFTFLHQSVHRILNQNNISWHFEPYLCSHAQVTYLLQNKEQEKLSELIKTILNQFHHQMHVEISTNDLDIAHVDMKDSNKVQQEEAVSKYIQERI